MIISTIMKQHVCWCKNSHAEVTKNQTEKNVLMVARILIAKHKMLKGLFCSCMWLDDFLHFTYSLVAQYAWKFFVSQKIIPAKTIWLSKDLYTCFSVMYDKIEICLSWYYTVSTTVYVAWLKWLKISFKSVYQKIWFDASPKITLAV